MLAVAGAIGIPIALIAAILAGRNTALLFALMCVVGMLIAFGVHGFDR